MIRTVVDTIRSAVSEEQLMETVALIASHHRIQASQGYRDAAIALVDRAASYGIAARVDSYPARYGERYLTMDAFSEWNCRAAHCCLIAPERIDLADFAAEPISVMQKSFPYHGEPLAIVMMDRGTKPEQYTDMDLRDKLLFIREDFNPYLWAIRERGAKGFISDYVVENPGCRTRADQMDVRKYTSFWWEKPPAMAPFGFVITPRMGDALDALCRTAEKPPIADCLVDADFSDGFYENVVLELPGETDEEVWLVAHLCHPRPSANDNASGSSAALEALRVIRCLTLDGTLPPLRRTVKVLLVPEFTGIFAHLSRLEHPHQVVGALNLDMIGGNQALGYGPLTLSGLSYACPSVVFELAKMILEALRQEVPGFSKTTFVPGFNSTVCGFTAGSDHFILQDPTIGIPAPMLGQWPDKFYHTSGDTPNVVSPHLLKQSTALAASYGYILAAMERTQLEEILLHSAASMTAELARINSGYSFIPEDIARGYITEYYLACADSAGRLVPDCDDLIRRSSKRLKELSAAMGETVSPSSPGSIDSRIPRRTYVSPINRLASHTGGEESREQAAADYAARSSGKHTDGCVTEILLQYYIDGKRTVDDIISRVMLETNGGSRDAMIHYIDTLAKLGLCEFETGGCI